MLNSQWDRFERQAETREANGLYLAERLARIPGIAPQERTADCTRHAYHLFSLRFDPAVFGVSREVFLEALAAEGLTGMAGYVIPLYKQPLFEDRAFGPFTGCLATRPDLDYRQTSCPNCETISNTQGVWLEHRYMLGSRADMDDVAVAFEKLYELRAQLGG